MQVRAIAKNIGIPPRKMRLVTNAVKGLRVNEALAILQFLPQAGATPVSKVVSSAAANAENNYNLDPDDLYILNIVADDSVPDQACKTTFSWSCGSYFAPFLSCDGGCLG